MSHMRTCTCTCARAHTHLSRLRVTNILCSNASASLAASVVTVRSRSALTSPPTSSTPSSPSPSSTASPSPPSPCSIPSSLSVGPTPRVCIPYSCARSNSFLCMRACAVVCVCVRARARARARSSVRRAHSGTLHIVRPPRKKLSQKPGLGSHCGGGLDEACSDRRDP